jgi:acetyl esterase/lipase
MKTLFFSLLFMTIYTMNAGAAQTPGSAIAADTFLNIAYGTSALQRMDVYLPANRSSVKPPSLILLHGGGWNSGSRHSLSAYIDSFKRRMPGYAIFNIDYRLISANTHFTDQEKDITSAVDFIAAHSEEYNINPEKFVMVGISAGAHLALLQSYKYSAPNIAAVVDFFGPVNLISMYNNPWNAMIPHLMESAIGGTPQTNNDYQQLSPVSFINAGTPPTLIFHGKQDHIVDISQSQLLQSKLQQAGVKNKLVIYPNGGHGWFGNTLSDSFDKIQLFLDALKL